MFAASLLASALKSSAGGGPAYDPTADFDLIFDFINYTGQYQERTGTPPSTVVDSTTDPIGSILDQVSGTAYARVPSSDSNRPLSADDGNGVHFADCDGSNDGFVFDGGSSGALAAASGFYAVWLMQYVGNSGPDGFWSIATAAAAAYNSSHGAIAQFNTGPTMSFKLGSDNNNGIQLSCTPTGGVDIIEVLVRADKTASLYLNGTEVSTDTALQSPGTMTDTQYLSLACQIIGASASVGQNANCNLYWHGYRMSEADGTVMSNVRTYLETLASLA